MLDLCMHSWLLIVAVALSIGAQGGSPLVEMGKGGGQGIQHERPLAWETDSLCLFSWPSDQACCKAHHFLQAFGERG